MIGNSCGALQTWLKAGAPDEGEDYERALLEYLNWLAVSLVTDKDNDGKVNDDAVQAWVWKGDMDSFTEREIETAQDMLQDWEDENRLIDLHSGSG